MFRECGIFLQGSCRMEWRPERHFQMENLVQLHWVLDFPGTCHSLFFIFPLWNRMFALCSSCWFLFGEHMVVFGFTVLELDRDLPPMVSVLDSHP